MGEGTVLFAVDGPVRVEDVAGTRPVTGLAYEYDRPGFVAEDLTAEHAGAGDLTRIVTDKGEFVLSAASPVHLAHGGSGKPAVFIPARHVRVGQRLLACQVDSTRGEYLRLGLRDGNKGKELLHRIVARDQLGVPRGQGIIHHKDENRFNNVRHNLMPMDHQGEHAGEHARKLVAEGNHVFQRRRFSKAGAANPMWRGGDFWKDPEKSAAYRAAKSAEMKARDPAALQAKSSAAHALNIGWRLINAGHSVQTFDEFCRAYALVIGRIDSKPRRKASIEARFGSYQGYLATLNAQNHKVLAAEYIGEGPLYRVEATLVENGEGREGPVPFVIWPEQQRAGSGIVVGYPSVTRR